MQTEEGGFDKGSGREDSIRVQDENDNFTHRGKVADRIST